MLCILDLEPSLQSSLHLMILYLIVLSAFSSKVIECEVQITMLNCDACHDSVDV
jgi:hypothetical protein